MSAFIIFQTNENDPVLIIDRNDQFHPDTLYTRQIDNFLRFDYMKMNAKYKKKISIIMLFYVK